MSSKLSERIWRTRKNRKMSREQLARMIDVSANSLYNYEKGVQIPSATVLQRIAQSLEVSVDYLLGNVDDPLPPAKKKAISPTVIESETVPALRKMPSPDTLIEEVRNSSEVLSGVPTGWGIDFALYMQKDELGRYLNKGSYALIRLNVQPQKNGEPVLVDVNGQILIREYYRYGNTVVLRSGNLKDKEIETPASKCRILGVVDSKYEKISKASDLS